jgi:AraC-like DNA-binding protein
VLGGSTFSSHLVWSKYSCGAADHTGIFDGAFPLFSLSYQRDFIATLINSLYGPLVPPEKNRCVGRRHMIRVQEFIKAHYYDPITTEDMAAAAGISVRTLRDLCHDLYGLRPKEILRNMRINEAWKRFHHPQPGDTVASIAHELLFTNPGEFAGYYQALLHEDPLTTLQRARIKGYTPGFGTPARKPGILRLSSLAS